MLIRRRLPRRRPAAILMDSDPPNPHDIQRFFTDRAAELENRLPEDAPKYQRAVDGSEHQERLDSHQRFLSETAALGLARGSRSPTGKFHRLKMITPHHRVTIEYCVP